MWLVRLLLVVAVVVAVWYVVRAIRAGGLPSLSAPVSFTPVDELPGPARAAIDAELDQDRLVPAVRHYRAATGAGPREARTAVETYRWKRGRAGA